MEAAGLAIGVIGLGGLVGAFKDAIDLFGLIASSSMLGRDHEILEIKFDIQRTLLLQWAHRVTLLDECSYDRRLDQPQIQDLVTRLLGHIKWLLTDGTALKQKYGLREVTEVERTKTDDDRESRKFGEHRKRRFIEEFEALELRASIRQQSTSLGMKTKWVIRDKQKFDCLIKELDDAITKLNELVPVTQDYPVPSLMADDDLAAVQDIRVLRLLIMASDRCRHAISELAPHALTKTFEERILDTLWFQRIDDRRLSIGPAHNKTLEWAFKSSSDFQKGADLGDWLRDGSGLFWISGKAGSGKSTLMKYLHSHNHTQDLLSQWARGGKHFICDFFFSNIGTTEQKTQGGLARTLLYQILSNHRGLIPQVLPDMWKEQQNCDGYAALPSQAELKYAFEALPLLSSDLGRFCFFIDGLDELEGDYREGIAFVKSLATIEHFKIIVSSRPIPDCVACFGKSPLLDMQKLNHDDITSYVEDVIGKHPYMGVLMRRHPNEAAQMTGDLLSKASGVFLWVVLPCRSLTDGFANFDRISELRRRVDELPPELEDMFRHMLSKISARHRDECSQLLHIGQAQPRDLYTLGLALIFEDEALSALKKPLSLQDKRDLCNAFEGRLRSRCIHCILSLEP